MNEKITEIPIRKEKIKRLKEKINKEIEKEMELCKRDLIYDLSTEFNKEEFCKTIEIIHCLNVLQKYVDCEWSFMVYLFRDLNNDVIIYEIPIKYIDIWLQDDYRFVTRIVHDATTNGLIVEIALEDDYYFGRDYMNSYEFAKYDNKMED